MRFVNTALQMLQGFCREFDTGLGAMFNPPSQTPRRMRDEAAAAPKHPRKDKN
jgi:hypothetical protein